MARTHAVSCMARALSPHRSCQNLLPLYRSFFASSTDHTTLVANAVVHVLPSGDDKIRQYMLVADNMPVDVVAKEPKLGLARLFVEGNAMFGVKVINRALGKPVDVCGKLVDAAMSDISTGQPTALASLDGLCSWVEKGIIKNDSPLLKELQTHDKDAFEAVEAIATGKPRPGHQVLGQGTFRDGQDGWEALAAEFVDQGLSDESELYLSKGGKLAAIESLADTSKDYLSSAGGAMARFSFS